MMKGPLGAPSTEPLFVLGQLSRVSGLSYLFVQDRSASVSHPPPPLSVWLECNGTPVTRLRNGAKEVSAPRSVSPSGGRCAYFAFVRAAFDHFLAVHVRGYACVASTPRHSSVALSAGRLATNSRGMSIVPRAIVVNMLLMRFAEPSVCLAGIGCPVGPNI